jgi:hypothetical protein
MELDALTQKIVHRFRSGNWTNCTQAEAPFKRIAEQLTLEERPIVQATPGFHSTAFAF